ncbi:hypothetical protein GCM10023238_28410 [Streptomyces heliomycini]
MLTRNIDAIVPLRLSRPGRAAAPPGHRLLVFGCRHGRDDGDGGHRRRPCAAAVSRWRCCSRPRACARLLLRCCRAGRPAGEREVLDWSTLWLAESVPADGRPVFSGGPSSPTRPTCGWSRCGLGGRR